MMPEKNLPRTTNVAIATKFESESTITRLVHESSTRSLYTTGGCGDQDVR